ncbi:uncharacterized protein K452DRAFT_51012 [Aplosporella prunicola CBS 121167]|uniref:Uncharacterized protein n=1 Tax=Aplosporella prunicola CBS 121167 TaxID=1176127 RepID=A0A6A6B986_9PEZI|nr:uncharacterized protein K452DRAFT_51012 [Aplosporella prunicola CBS 121167]KAF2140769.1 hypothetical protein K452DRAFT_51012 [Aplosporella prunicola CBS 121167]
MVHCKYLRWLVLYHDVKKQNKIKTQHHFSRKACAHSNSHQTTIFHYEPHNHRTSFSHRKRNHTPLPSHHPPPNPAPLK